LADKKELKALITLAGRIDPSLQSAMLKASGEALKLSNRLQNSARGMSNITTIAKGTFLGSLGANAFTAATRKMWDMSVQGLKLTSDLQEVQNVVDTTFGNSAAQINAWSKTTLKAFGLSELSAKQYSSTAGSVLKGFGVEDQNLLQMSQNLTALAGDLASFRNLGNEEAFQKIMSGMTGEIEPLKQVGIVMSVANLEAYALSKGIKTSFDKMDQASQTILRYNYLLEHTKDAQGDAAKTAESPANQIKRFDENTKALSMTLSQKALPYLNQLLIFSNHWIENNIDEVAANVSGAFERLGSMIQWTSDNSWWLIPALSGVAATFAAFKVIDGIAKAYQAWTLATQALTVAQTGLNTALALSPIGLAALVVGAGVAGYMTSKTLSPETKQASNKAASYSTAGRRRFGIGGIADQPSIFGEAGPEMAIPLQRTSRSLGLLNQTAKILGVGSGVNVTYAPVVQGGSAPEVQRVLEVSFEQFKRWAEDYFGDKGRVSFG
jgi:hypothetical protein